MTWFCEPIYFCAQNIGTGCRYKEILLKLPSLSVNVKTNIYFVIITERRGWFGRGIDSVAGHFATASQTHL